MPATMEANLVALRAESLVVVHLTRRPDIHVVKSPYDDFDLLATVYKRSRIKAKWFGLRVRAVLPDGVKGGFVRNAKSANSQSHRHVSPMIAFPACEMVVNVVSDEINWRWLLKPVADETGKHLRTNLNLTLASLTNEAVSTIVDVVNSWYDADGQTATKE